MKTRIKITATLLSFVMFMLAVPMLVWKASADEITNVVEEIKTNSFSVDIDNMTKGSQEKERYILSENIENREADSKEFIMSDGTIMVQQYAGRIHYMDNGEYKEIDNSLILTNKGYENKANSFKININKSMQSNENLVEISDDNYSISFDLINKKNVVETVTAGLNQARQVINYKDVRVNEPQSAMTVNGVVKFPDIQNDIDIEYKVENNGLKENIIVNKKQNSYNFDFQVNVENLALELTEEGVVLAKDNNEQIQFIIPAPFMTDKNGQFSDQVEYALSENEEGYVLTVEADSQWINNNAVLPVTIDPIIYKYEEVVNNFSFVNVFNNKSPVNSGEFGYVGKKDKARCNVYIRFNVPERGKTYKLLESNFNFYHKTGGINIFRGTNLKYTANVVSSSISMSNITYTNQPVVLQTLRDCGANVNVAPTTQQYSVGYNVGYIQNNIITFGLKFKDECSEYMYAYIYMTGEHAPFVTFLYKLSTGLDEEYSVESTEINGATAYVNNVTGNLTVNMNLASVNTMDLPFELSLVYNTEYNYILDKLNVSKMFGNNLKLNVQQYLKQFDTAYYYYYDSDGSGQVISADNNMPNQYSKNGKLKRDINGNLIDSQGNKLLFQSEKLTEIASLYNNQVGIVIDYNSSNKITNVDYITDETVFNCAFSYSGERVSSATVYCYGKQIAKYNLYYDSRGNLTRINNSLSGNDVLILSYDSGNKLTGIFNSRQEGLGFSYDGKAISNVYKYYGASPSGSVTNEEMQFLFNNQLTTVTTYSNNSKTSENYISYDKDYNVLSEWSKNASGEITVFQRGNWSQISLNGMEKRSYQYEQTLNTSLKTTKNLSANQSTTISIGADSGVENKSVKQYVVGFKVEQSSAINLSVTAGSATGSFTNSSGGTQYVILPCSYISSGSITIKNNGSGTAKISDVCFAAADYTYQKLSYDSSDIYVFYPSEITQITSTGYYTKNTYDRFGKTLTTETKNYLDTAVEKTTYTYGTTYFRPGGVSEPMISAVTTKSGSTIERIDNTYSETGVTKKRTKNGLKTRTVSTTQFNEAFKNSVTSSGTTLYRTLINVDENGVESSEQYSLTHGDIRLTSSISGNTKYVYEYNYDGDITSIKAYNGNTLLSSQTFTYTDTLNTGGNYQGYTYEYERNSNSFLTSISYNSDEKITYSYDVNNYLASKTYANNQSVVCDYLTNVGLLTSLRYKVGAELAADEYKYIYDNADELTSVKKVNGNNVKVQYSYDESSDKKENTLEISGDMYYNVSATSEYDLDRNALLNTQIKFMRDGSIIKTFTENNTYNNKNELTQTVFGNGKVLYTYDGLGRVNNKSIVGTNNRAIYGRDIVYKSYTADGETYTTNLVSAVENAYFNDDPVMYHYDDAGRITMQGTSTTSETYNYDDLNRLSGMTISGMSYSYAYDSKNNLLTETTTNRYNTVLDTTNYTYNAYGQLTSVANSGSTDYFRYDELGNMTMYKGGTASGTDNLSWCEGNKLAGGAFNENEFSYEYDPNGHRYKKIVNNAVTEYYLDGSRVIAENRIDDNVFIYYYYDQSGIIGMNYNGSDYYFGKNILGDITEIYNSSGTVVGSYEYDPWGLVKTITGEMAEKNPFRYRGYYFDAETGFYYLQTRYYDPSIRRFISADNYELIPKLSQTLGQLNMYAYCNNNPILFTDENGEGMTLTATLIVGFVITLIAGLDGGISASLSGGNFWIGFGVGFVSGAIGFGISLMPFLGEFAPYLGRITSSFLYDIFNPLFQKGKIETDDILNTMLDVSMDMALSGIYSGFLGFDVDANFSTNLWKGGVGAIVDGFVDVLQTDYIYNNLTKLVQKNRQRCNNDIGKYYLIGV